MPTNKRNKLRQMLMGAAISVILLFLAFSACVMYSLRSAEKRARQFCDEIAVGSNASDAVARAVSEKILYGTNDGYTFFFPTITGFDKAICEVAVDKSGKVTSKGWQMEID